MSVMHSLVCESNAGFSIRQLTKTRRCPLTCEALSVFSRPDGGVEEGEGGG